ncbi:MAG TPA: hypothetical protein VLB76_26835 [Thermoanaerobaculia bacterium]|jgi:hypothetical protein|nr:hypothetical protein [Thermoanaerobaculia bacterium]
MIEEADPPEFPPEVLSLEAERLRVAGTTDVSTVIRAGLSYGLGPEFASSEVAADLCALAERHGVERLFELLREAEGEVSR